MVMEKSRDCLRQVSIVPNETMESSQGLLKNLNRIFLIANSPAVYAHHNRHGNQSMIFAVLRMFVTRKLTSMVLLTLCE